MPPGSGPINGLPASGTRPADHSSSNCERDPAGRDTATAAVAALLAPIISLPPCLVARTCLIIVYRFFSWPKTFVWPLGSAPPRAFNCPRGQLAQKRRGLVLWGRSPRAKRYLAPDTTPEPRGGPLAFRSLALVRAQWQTHETCELINIVTKAKLVEQASRARNRSNSEPAASVRQLSLERLH